MKAFKPLLMVTLSLLANSATAVIKDSDFWFHDEGQSIFINGEKGAPLHIDYIGDKLTKPLKVRIRPIDPNLQVRPSVCKFTHNDSDCRLTLHVVGSRKKAYGIQKFDVTEIDKGINLSVEVEESVGFGLGVTLNDMPKPIQSYWTASFNRGGTTRKIIVTNGTSYSRDYQASVGVYFYFIACGSDGRDYGPGNYRKSSASISCAASGPGDGVQSKSVSREYNLYSGVFVLNGKQSCYLDYNITKPLGSDVTSADDFRGLWYTAEDNFVSDVTDSNRPNFNGLGITGNNNITNCSAVGNNQCASSQWGSWRVGLANMGVSDMDGGVRAGQVEVLQDYSWDNGGYIYWKEKWYSENLALVHIQGSIDGSENWNANAAAPSMLEVQSAPPCSYFLK